ncbi:hypothetical protein Pmani_014311 [Petrolisthes manimaculis]|uniref:Uncharacterized protein n=1 Tax=Petrolisthes manimaculis TaxID=1843537 RepID=A0AAE1PWI3_9EUCA|nr:hypothetical protein Pmani_014311 [Petrolisthes manimaculis]
MFTGATSSWKRRWIFDPMALEHKGAIADEPGNGREWLLTALSYDHTINLPPRLPEHSEPNPTGTQPNLEIGPLFTPTSSVRMKGGARGPWDRAPLTRW